MVRSHSAARGLLLLAMLVAAPLARAATAGDIATLRRNVVDYYTAGAANRFDPRVAASLAELEAQARTVTAPGFLRSDGSWTDIDYAEFPSGAWSPWEHFRRLTVMSKAYATPGQALYRDPALRGQIESVLTYLQTFYGTKASTRGNWWFWTIGPALDLGPSLVLVGGDITPSVRDASVEILAARIGAYPGDGPNSADLVGQNLVWSSLNHTMLAILRGDTAKMAQVHDRIAAACLPSAGSDGMQPDFSFHQHGPQLYTGGYGGSFAYEVSKYFLFARNTPWVIAQTDNSSYFFDYMVEGIAWSLCHNYFDVSVIGREASYSSATGFNGLAALLNMSAVSSTRAGEIRSAAAMMLRSWTATLPTELSGLAASLASQAPSWPSGNRQYPDSDYTIHRRPGWFASVKMLSTRTESGEDTNGENLLGSRQSDGRLYLVLRGDEYFTSNVWPTIDWARLPGITVEQQPDAAGNDYGTGKRSFVGGVSNGRNGVSAMDVAPVGSSLRARKTWVFFDDSIALLTSGIKCIGCYPVETIIDQRPVASSSTFVVDGAALKGSEMSVSPRWAAGDGIGYYFPSGGTVKVREDDRSGNWSALAVHGPSETVSNRMRTLVVEHGAAVTNGAAEYIVVPDKTADAMRRWADARPVSVLANDDTVAAARDERTGDTGIVFWTPGSIAGVTVDQPCVVYKSETSAQIRLWVTDPSRANFRIRVTLAGRLRVESGNVLLVVAQKTTTVDIPVVNGRTSHLVLSHVERRHTTRR